MTDHIPLTGSNKVDKAPLRAAAWNTDDTVYVRVARTAEYVPFDDDARARLEAEFAANGRAALLPAPAPAQSV